MSGMKLKEKQDLENMFSDNRYTETILEMLKLLEEVENLDNESLVDEIMEHLDLMTLPKNTADVVDKFFVRDLTERERGTLKGAYILINGKFGLME